jgi:hypothetical protein
MRLGFSTEFMRKIFLSFLKIVLLLFLFISIGALLPRELKMPFPRQWGQLEGIFNRDLTGLWFSSWQGEGDCRIHSAKLAFKLPGSKIILGEITPPSRKPYPHLWVEMQQGIIDSTCPPSQPACQNRRVYAIVNPETLAVESQNQLNDTEKKQVEWGIKYLAGLKSVSRSK